jgi:hypothetical protein
VCTVLPLHLRGGSALEFAKAHKVCLTVLRVCLLRVGHVDVVFHDVVFSLHDDQGCSRLQKLFASCTFADATAENLQIGSWL